MCNRSNLRSGCPFLLGSKDCDDEKKSMFARSVVVLLHLLSLDAVRSESLISGEIPCCSARAREVEVLVRTASSTKSCSGSDDVDALG